MESNLYLELREVVSDEFKKVIDEIFKDNQGNTNAQFLLELCRLITKQIDIVVKEYYLWSKYPIKLYTKGNGTDISEQKEQQLMVFGTQLIYTLRSFIHNEEIVFHLASKTNRGNYEASAFVSQKEILKSLSSVTKKAIGVSNLIQKDLIRKNQYNTAYQIKRQNLWNQVEFLATPITDNKASNKINVGKNGKKHYAFQSLKKDIMVYVAYYGKKDSSYVKYYNMDGGNSPSSLMAFNNGWLWEWYNKILYGGSDEEYMEANNSIMAGSLRPIMFGPDYVRGTKEGDFQDLQKRQVQSKYNNSKIISYNNIRQVVYELEKALEIYIEEEQGATNKLLDVLQEHFFPESAKIGEKYSDDIVNDLLNKLNTKT